MTDRNTTDVLKGDLDDDENVRWLSERFRGTVRAVIQANIPSHLQKNYDVEAAIETTLRQGLVAARNKDAYRASSDVFRGLVRSIAKKKRADQLRRMGSQSRDVSREEPSSEHKGFVIPDFRNLAPDEAAMLQEFLELRIKNLMKEEDPVRQQINLLAIGQDMNAREIIEHLKARPEGFRVPSEPTVRKQIDRAKEIDEQTIRDYCDDSEDDT